MNARGAGIYGYPVTLWVSHGYALSVKAPIGIGLASRLQQKSETLLGCLYLAELGAEFSLNGVVDVIPLHYCSGQRLL